MTAERILAVARGELGVTESPAGSNRVKYNTAYYRREVSGSAYPWCCAFLWWVFRQAGAAELFFGGSQTAYCPALLDFHKKQRVTDYRPGDIIFFNFNGRGNAAHVGLCESWDGRCITTIDGNTGTGNEANGGAVMRRTRDKKYIVGAYRPAYKEEDTDLTQEQFEAMLTAWLLRQAAQPASSWSRMAEAKAAGITDGTRPGSFATREEVATMIMAAR
ncbi:MAG: CHAP domain-containing protein [Ruminococcaceae bacterium]|nr:CHAP domain-containing protein [Oscillospiraceae bacterium]